MNSASETYHPLVPEHRHVFPVAPLPPHRSPQPLQSSSSPHAHRKYTQRMCARTPRPGITHHGARSTEHCAQTRLSLLSVISVCGRGDLPVPMPPTASLGGRCCAAESRCPTTARRLRPPPPCLSRSHGPSDRWRPPTPRIQNSMQQLAATTRLGVKKKIYSN